MTIPEKRDCCILQIITFTDNQPDFTYLKPYEEKSFVQYFMPYKAVGAVKNASTEVVMNMETVAGEENQRTLRLSLYAPGLLTDITAKLVCDGEEVFAQKMTLKPGETFEKLVGIPAAGEITFSVLQGDMELSDASCTGDAGQARENCAVGKGSCVSS